ncbi:MAG: hypothetical protein PHF67_02685 [Candidatus Nanoarchaeia archaeon]|nr:hypothetical protein [Candidatus Nanoarchaeia archaeon]
MSELNSKCGIFVAHSLHDVYNGLKNLQHRGEDSCGIAALKENGDIDVLRWQGKVLDFSLETAGRILDGGVMFIGEVRYSTRSQKSPELIFMQSLPRFYGGRISAKYGPPKFVHLIARSCDAAIAHNGNLQGVNPRGDDSDTDILLKFYMQNRQNGIEQIIRVFPGAYSCAILDRNRPGAVVFKDRYAIRPLVIGKKDGRLIASSEDRAIIEIGGQPMRDVKPGEMVLIPPNGTKLEGKQILKREKRPCFFCRPYLGHVLSSFRGILNLDTRRRLGVALAQEYHPEVDFVSYIPNAPEDYARAYADFRNLEFVQIFYKVKFNRAFLGESDLARKKSIGENLYVMDDIDLAKKRVLLLEDSVVRFNNAPDASRKLRDKGVSWIGLAVGTPPIGINLTSGELCGCEKGVDMPLDDNFAARRFRTLDEMARFGDYDEIYYVSKSGLESALRRELGKCCARCIGEPDPIQEKELEGLGAIVDDVYRKAREK